MTTLVTLNNLSTVAAKALPGDTIVLSDGTYVDLSITIPCNGQPGKRVTIKPLNPGKVVLSGSSTITISGSYVTLANLVLKDGGNTGKVVVLQGSNNRITGFDVSMTATSCEQMFRIENRNNRIDHCVFRDWNKAGVWVVVWRPNSNENFAMIDHNVFRNRIPTGAANGLECVRIGTSDSSLSSSKTIVMQNVFENCNGEIEIISNKSGENIYYRNVLANSEGTLTLRHGNKCFVYNNLFDQNKKPNSGGVRVTGENHIVEKNLFRNIVGNGTTRCGVSINNGVPNTALNGYYQVKQTKVRNNVFVNCSNDFAVGVKVKAECTLTPVSTVVENNIGYHDNADATFSTNATVLYGPGTTYSNNTFYASNIGKAPSTGVEKKDPSTFNLSTIDVNQFGVNEKTGLLWGETEPEQTELKVDNETFYTRLLTELLSSSSTNTPPSSNIPVTPAIIETNWKEMYGVSQSNVLLIKSEVNKVLSQVNAWKATLENIMKL